MKELRFATKECAVQYLSDLLNKAIRIANDATETTDEPEKVLEELSEAETILLNFEQKMAEQDKLLDNFDRAVEEFKQNVETLRGMLKEYDEEESTNGSFTSLDNAIQYLSDLTGMRIRIENA